MLNPYFPIILFQICVYFNDDLGCTLKYIMHFCVFEYSNLTPGLDYFDKVFAHLLSHSISTPPNTTTHSLALDNIY